MQERLASRRAFLFARPRVGSAGPCPADRFRDRGGASLFFSREKKSNQKKRAAGREPSLRAGTLRFSVRRGTARELATLRHPRLFALAGPAVLGSL
ncbi:hypothetical protein BN1263460076 [Stenotrophomonas indicatrix]|nr:hypothetical protein BN1263460076 [Stenotrophomonas indicatrix]